MSAQATHCHSYSKVYNQYFLLSVVYGANASQERKSLWEEFKVIKTNILDVPWFVCGDFNTELNMSERSENYDGMACSQNSLDFKQCLDEVELSDLPSTGSFLIWSNKRSSGYLAKKLDRFLVNECWLDGFSGLRASFLPRDFSDHCIGVLYAVGQQRTVGSFKFNNYLAKHKNFMPIVSQHWGSSNF